MFNKVCEIYYSVIKILALCFEQIHISLYIDLFSKSAYLAPGN